VSILVSCFGAPSETVDPVLRKLNMICGVHGSPGYRLTEPTWSKRTPVGTALICAAGFFICAQPATPARAAAAMNEINKNFFIPNESELLVKSFRKFSLFALLCMNAM